MTRYILRLDDAAEKYDREKWQRIEELLDRYAIKPLVGIIPDCKDPAFEKYESDSDFWNRVYKWAKKDWVLALHGCNHVYCTCAGGINPVNLRSEFAGLTLKEQKEKIEEGVRIVKSKGLQLKVFFAPSHTFDENTLTALRECSEIRLISDTIAYDVYTDGEFTYVPQQACEVRRLPLKTVTFCYHPDTMNDRQFIKLERFIASNSSKFISFPLEQTSRKEGRLDRVFRRLYFLKRQCKVKFLR